MASYCKVGMFLRFGKMTFLAKMASNVNFVTLFSKQNTSKFASVTKLHKKSNLLMSLFFALRPLLKKFVVFCVENAEKKS